MDDEPLFTEREIQTLIMACLNGSAPEPVDEEQLHAFIDWASQVKVDAALLHNVLKEKITVQRAPDGEWVFKSSTPPGT